MGAQLNGKKKVLQDYEMVLIKLDKLYTDGVKRLEHLIEETIKHSPPPSNNQ